MHIKKSFAISFQWDSFPKKSLFGVVASITFSILQKGMGRQFCLLPAPTMASLRHILMGRNTDYLINYFDYLKYFDAVLKLLIVI